MIITLKRGLLCHCFSCSDSLAPHSASSSCFYPFCSSAFLPLSFLSSNLPSIISLCTSANRNLQSVDICCVLGEGWKVLHIGCICAKPYCPLPCRGRDFCKMADALSIEWQYGHSHVCWDLLSWCPYSSWHTWIHRLTQSFEVEEEPG